jgi:hypothetical protein
MEEYIGPLILLATLAGLVWVILGVWWLIHRKQLSALRRIVLVFAGIGVLVPLVTLLIWDWINAHGSFSAMGTIQDVALRIWPTSIELMALDSPAPGPTLGGVVLVYSVSTLGNVGIYGTLGFIVAGIWDVARSKHSGATGEQ